MKSPAVKVQKDNTFPILHQTSGDKNIVSGRSSANVQIKISFLQIRLKLLLLLRKPPLKENKLKQSI